MVCLESDGCLRVITKRIFAGDKALFGVKHRQNCSCNQVREYRIFRPISIFLPDPLTPEELAALKVVAVAPPLRGLPYKIQRRLVDLGFAETVRGGLIATEDGLLRIQQSLNENLRD